MFTVKGGKFKLSAQGRNLAPFVGNETIVKIPSDYKLSLIQSRTRKSLFVSDEFELECPELSQAEVGHLNF